MYGVSCGCDCGGPRFARWPSRSEQVRWLEEYKHDLERRAAAVADEIRQLTEKPADTI